MVETTTCAIVGGDTVHPTTMRLLDELGLWERFAALAFTEVRKAKFESNGHSVTYVDFDRLRLPHRFVAMVPQWDLLNLLADAARDEPSFSLRMNTEVTGLLWESGRVAGVRYQGAEGPGELRAELTVACDGRWSIARREAGLKAGDFPVKFDVWWFRLPHEEDTEFSFLPRVGPGKALAVIPRERYFQIAYLGPKGTDAQLRARRIDAFRSDVAALLPDMPESVAVLRSMDEVKHLDVRVNRLRRWHTDGLLCIGDAAHATSPLGGVGINVAVQDAVAAATILADPLRDHRVTGRDLAAVRRRLFALLERLPWLSIVPAYFVGVGVQPEHAPAFARRKGENRNG